MLEQLLQLVAEGGVHRYEELTRRLSVSEPMLEMMLEELVRLEYLRKMGDGCEGRCGACPIGGCSVEGPGRIWSLTEKGGQAAAKLAL